MARTTIIIFFIAGIIVFSLGFFGQKIRRDIVQVPQAPYINLDRFFCCHESAGGIRSETPEGVRFPSEGNECSSRGCITGQGDSNPYGILIGVSTTSPFMSSSASSSMPNGEVPKKMIPQATSSSQTKKSVLSPLSPSRTFLPPISIGLPESSSTIVSTSSPTENEPTPSQEESIPQTTLPTLNEEPILKAVVKIQCPTKDGLGKYIGSGFIIQGNIVVTAAHLVMDSGSEMCDVIFPRERRPIHYLKGTIDRLSALKRRHDEEGIDIAFLTFPPLDTYPEARAVFQEYPSIQYPICKDPVMLGDSLLHYGYPSNYADQNYLSRLEGKAVAYADIKGIKDQLSEDQSYTFKSPIFGFTNDQSSLHPYMVSRVASFYGDSGGLAFNATKQCILGPHRGGSIGRREGENYSILMLLGWEQLKSLFP